MAEQIIQLDQFMKLCGLVATGGQAKVAIQSGEVLLNGVVETRRKKKLKAGDKVTFADETFVVAFEEAEE
jgi:ribosome-associated protein